MALPRIARTSLAIAVSVTLAGGGATALGAPIQRHRHKQEHRGGHRRRHRRRPCVGANATPTTRDLPLIRWATLCLVNRERTVRGLPPLRPNARLRAAARGHSESMAGGDYFEHYGPGGQSPLSRMRAAGYISSSRAGFEVGENIAWGTGTLATPGAIVAAWMASPGHRANILDRGYRETGIGVSPNAPAALSGGQPGAIYTQDFGVIIAR